MSDKKTVSQAVETTCKNSRVDFLYYAAVQNGVILDVFDSYDEALDRVKEEQQRDLVSIIIKRKLRKLLKKSGNVALHRYSIITFIDSEDIK